MKKTVLLSAITSSLLYSYQISEGSFNSGFGEFSSSAYSNVGSIGDSVGSFEGSGFSGFSGSYTNPEDLNEAPEVEMPTSISLYEDGKVEIDISVSDSENDDVTITYSDGTRGRISQSGDKFYYIGSSNRNGSDEITFTFDDGFDGVVEKSLKVSIIAVDDAPYLLAIPNVTVVEDSAEKVVSLKMNDVDSSVEGTVFSVTGGSEIVNTSISGSSLILVPKADSSGSATISVSAKLGAVTDTKTFTYIVTEVDDMPVLGAISDIEVAEDSGSKEVSLQISDVDSDVSNVSYTLSGTPDFAEVTLSGSSIILTPKPEASGESEITVVAKLDGNTISESFKYVVLSEDDTPILGAFENLESSENSSLPISISDVDSNLEDVSYSISSSNSDIAEVSIVDGKIEIVPKDGASGETEITVTAELDGQTVSQSFTYTIPKADIEPPELDFSDVSFESQKESFAESLSFATTNVASISASSSNSDLVSVYTNLEGGELVLNISGNSTGKAKVEVEAKNSEGDITTESFEVEIYANRDQIALGNAELTFETIRGENETQNYVRTDLDLITDLNDIPVSWKSSNEDIISTSGEIFVSDEKDFTILLTATLELGDFENKKSFLITVPKEELTDEIAVKQAVENLTFNSIRGENSKRSEIYYDLNLYTESVSGTSIVWSSSSEAISESGEVTRSNTDILTSLVAEVSKGEVTSEKSFALIVKAEKVDNSEIVLSDYEWLTYSKIIAENRSRSEIEKDVNLYTVAPNGSDISWESSNSAISEDGEVIRDEVNDKYVTVEATLQSGDFSQTKEFLLKVLKIVSETEESIEFDRIEDDGNTITLYLENNISTSVSVDENLEADKIVFDDSVKIVLENNTSLLTTTLSSDGTSKSEVETEDGVSEISLNSVGTSEIGEDGTVSVSSGNSSATLQDDGSTTHSVGTTVANSKLVGTTVSVSENGAETTYEKVLDGIVVKAVIKTDNEENTETTFSVTDTATGETVQFDSTLADGETFPEGSEVEIDVSESGEIEITIRTTVDSLEIK
jgi:hypothetical protein